jgi:hypothetical protein
MQTMLRQCEIYILREINCRCSQREVAQTYRLAMASQDAGVDTEINWGTINQAIIDRWSLSGLERIKKMAWSGSCFEEQTK